jgi:hypothetical protein
MGVYNHKLSIHVQVRENAFRRKYNENHLYAQMHAILFPLTEKEKPIKGKRKRTS